MEAKIANFFESIGLFFSKGGDEIPWSDGDIVRGCDREVVEAINGTEEQKSESLRRLSWALVHSDQPGDVHRGNAMLDASLSKASTPLQRREGLYLLAVVYYRTGDYSRSREVIGHCLEIEPEWRQALILKNIVEDRISKDGVLGIGITATTVGIVFGVLTAILIRK